MAVPGAGLLEVDGQFNRKLLPDEPESDTEHVISPICQRTELPADKGIDNSVILHRQGKR
jgi:hypothetical protein